MTRCNRASRLWWAAIPASISLLMGDAALAQVPTNIADLNREVGAAVEFARTSAAYAPLHRDEPYNGVVVIRGRQYGAAPRAVLDLFKPAAATSKPPILIFLPGGPGAIHGDGPYGKRLDDNVMLWAARHGMVGLLVQWESGPGVAWDQGARNVGEALAWVRANAALHGGDVGRVYLWGHSSGAQTLATYLARPELHPTGMAGVRAAVVTSGGYNLAPVTTPSTPAPQGDPQVRLSRSLLQEIPTLAVALFVNVAEFDPPVLVEMAHALQDQLCLAGHCPRYARFKDHGHMSTIYSVNTADESVSGQVLDFIQHGS